MPPCPLFHLELEILYKFCIPFILMYYQKTNILPSKGDQNIKILPDYKVVPWRYQVVLEILWWGWKVEKVMLRHSPEYKMGKNICQW